MRPGSLLLAQTVDGAMLLAFGALVVWRGWSWSRRAGWSPRQNLALLGAVTFTAPLMSITQVALGEALSNIPFYSAADRAHRPLAAPGCVTTCFLSHGRSVNS